MKSIFDLVLLDFSFSKNSIAVFISRVCNALYWMFLYCMLTALEFEVVRSAKESFSHLVQ